MPLFNPRIHGSRHDFSHAPQARIPRSVFDRSHRHLTTINSGYLYPIYVDEVLPGDTFKLNMTALGRLATPITPFMDNVYFDTFFHFVPYRLLWDNWEKFNGAQDNPGDTTSYLCPTVTAPGSGGVADGTLYDYFGVPTKINSIVFNNFAGRAYNLIWNEWFRDENLQNSVVVDTDNGPDTYTDYVLLKRGKRHDYFTSCLPMPQKGTAVSLPLGSTAPVIGNGKSLGLTDGTTNWGLVVSPGNGLTPWTGALAQTLGGYHATGSQGASKDLGVSTTSANSGLIADLTSATAATINQLRQAFQIQGLLERDMQGGTRYVEILKAHFGVTAPDFRLQRPEYLGGGHIRLNVTPIAQTSSTDATTPQGNLTGVGTVYTDRNGFTKSFVEHGIVIGLGSVRADLTYQSGLNRMWSRQTRYDFYWPALAHLGEQSVLNQEIYMQGTSADTDTFGYQERYAEYKYKPSVITSYMRSQATGTLDNWHLAQKFTSLPTLNATFIQESPPLDRVLAVSEASGPQILIDMEFKLHCARPMPLYSMPAVLSRF